MASGPTRLEVMRGFLPHSPFPLELGMEVVELEPDRAVLRLPWRPQLATIADVVHGGAIATLIDTAGMAAAWADRSEPGEAAGSTIGMSVDFVDAARGEDLTANATVIRRGQSLCFCEVEVRDEGDTPVATALVSYRLG